MAHQERTFIAIKPDGVQRGLVGEIIKRFEQKGFRLVAMKFLQVTRPPHHTRSCAGAPTAASRAPRTSPSPSRPSRRSRPWGQRAQAPSQG